MRKDEKDPNDKDNRPFKCQKCGKDFRREDYLRSHMQTQHADDRQMFNCTQCDKVFTNSSNLKLHLSTHTGVFRFNCPRGFSTQTVLNKHLASHRRGARFKTKRVLAISNCSLCPRRFAKDFQLSAHFARHENGTVDDSTDSEQNLIGFDANCADKRTSQLVTSEATSS
ncbi:hypothetical protein PRIPAC_89397 [Pristionchus pacificus]|nr:hypothetical protein PRIPAC_89397 [Pristionchus pacificus]